MPSSSSKAAFCSLALKMVKESVNKGEWVVDKCNQVLLCLLFKKKTNELECMAKFTLYQCEIKITCIGNKVMETMGKGLHG